MKNKIIEKHLQENNLTLKQFANLCGVTNYTMQKLANCNGKRIATENIVAVSEEIGITTHEFLLELFQRNPR